MDLLFGGLLVTVGIALGVFARKWEARAMRERAEIYRVRYEEMCVAAGVEPVPPAQVSVHRYRVYKRRNPLARAVIVYSGDNGAKARRDWEHEPLGGEQVVELWDGKDLRGRREAP